MDKILKKHKSLLADYENQKRKHLEKLATKLINMDQKNQLLKNKKMSNDFLDNLDKDK